MKQVSKMIIYSMVLQMQLVNAIGRSSVGFVGSLPGFGIGMIIAFLQSDGKLPDFMKDILK